MNHAPPRGSPTRALVDPLLNYTQIMRDFASESRTTSWRRIQRGEVPAFRVGRRWKIRQSDFIRLIERMEAEGQAG